MQDTISTEAGKEGLNLFSGSNAKSPNGRYKRGGRGYRSVKIWPYWSLILVVSLLYSCQRKSDFYFVKNAGAIMPVKVRGNEASNNFILLLPGGPSGDGLVYSQVFPLFKQYLEPRYRMVYYDQRGAGNCQGVYDTTTLNLQQLSADLHKVVTTIKDRYPNATLYLLGYSYGGALGMHYLLEAQYRSDIAGFISVAGAFDRANQAELQAKLIEYCLEEWVKEGYLETYEPLKTGFTCATAQDVSSCRQDSVAISQKVAARFKEMERYNQFSVNSATIGRFLHYIFFSQSNPINSGIVEAQNGRYYQAEFNELMLSEKIDMVDTPVLFINGRYDTNVPFFTAQNGYNRIGTSAAHKSLIILEKSGHLPMMTEPQTISECIITFIKNN